MERLTARDEQGFSHYPYCFEKCNGDSVGIKCQTCDFEEKICNRLAEYEDLEEQGLLLKLPCKIGDVVYEFVEKIGKKGHWEEDKYFVDEWEKNIIREREFNLYMLASGRFGKTVFLTEQEAQAALEKMKGGGVNG